MLYRYYFMIISFVYSFFFPFALFPSHSLQFLFFLLHLLTFFPGPQLAPSEPHCWNSSLAPSCRLFLYPWFIYSPHQSPSYPIRPALIFRGGQPLGRTDRPCKSFGCCNKISSSWDLWGQTHVEEETPTVHEIVKNAKYIDRRKRCPNSLQFSFLPTWFCVFFNLSSRYHRYSNGQFRCFFGALEISVYIINRNVPAGDCNVIIKYSSGCWVYWILLNEICGVCVRMQCV